MKRFLVLLLALLVCSTAHAGWVKGTSLTRTNIFTDTTIPTTATNTSVDCRDFNGIVIESTQGCLKVLRPYAWSTLISKYVPIATSAMVTTLSASQANIRVGTGQTIMFVPNTYGYDNVFVGVVKSIGLAGNTKGNITYKCTPVQLIDYKR